MQEVRGWIENGIVQTGGLRVLYGWYDCAGRYDAIFLRESGRDYAFRIVYEYQRPDLERGTGFLAEIVYGVRSLPDWFVSSSLGQGNAMITMHQDANTFEFLGVLPSVRSLIASLGS